MNKEKSFKLLCLLLEYLNNDKYIDFDYVYGTNKGNEMTVSVLIEMLFQDYMR